MTTDTFPKLVKLDRLSQLLLLAVTVLIYSVLGMAIANSLFVSHVGAKHLPQAFILIGLCSMPAYAVFSQIVDRYSRPQLFRYVLLISVGVILGLRLLLLQESAYAYYILLIAIFFQWDFHNNVLYPSLLTDYFTTLEYKRYAPYIGIAQAVGTLLGGGLTALLSHYFRTRDLLLFMPVVFLIGVAQLIYLERSQRRVNVGEANHSTGIIESLRTFPELVRRYPLALFLASSSFLLVIIYTSSEFLWFSIYGSHFSEQALTGFLGGMRIVISLVQVAVIYGATRPLLKTLGVAQMNPVYPLTTLASFAGLLFHFGLPAAIGLHVNGDALYKGINLPVHQLNYNAIPREFVGRIRSLSDGLIYAVGLTLAGTLLWISETRLSLVQVAWLVTGLTVLLLLVRLPMGRFYASGLEAMIRSDSLDLDEFDLYPIQLTPQSTTAVKDLLTDGDRYSQIKGLELAARMGHPDRFLLEVESIVVSSHASHSPPDSQVYEHVIALFSHSSPELQATFSSKLQAPELRAFALEILLINHDIPAAKDIKKWLADPHEDMRILAKIAYLIANSSDSAQASADFVPHGAVEGIEEADAAFWPNPLTPKAARIITRVVAYSKEPRLAPLIPNVVLTQTSPDIVRTGLEALQPLTYRGDDATAYMAQSKLNHYDPTVKIAALNLLRINCCDQALPAIGDCLGDDDPRVRAQAARALAAYGRAGVDLAKASLNNTQVEVVNAAITAIGLVRSRYASNVLFDYLAPSYALLSDTCRWQAQIPTQAPSWQALSVAIVDYHSRLIQKVLYILSALGHARTVNAVNRLLATNAQVELENAIEVLASLNHRRFVVPLMPLLEALVSPSTTESVGEEISRVTPIWLKTKGYRLLLEALESNDRWIKSGALIALAMVPATLVNDPDPFVKQVASQIFETTLPAKTVMNRLLLLKSVSLFKNLSLDELMLIDENLDQTQVLAGATIFTEGDLAAHLYIIAEGQVQLVKEIDGAKRSLRQIGKGDYFGEVALFDDAPLWDGAIAQTDCTLLKLEKNQFLSLITQRPHMILEICRFLSQRLRQTDHYRLEKTTDMRPLLERQVDS
ncbi:cyclic nucleotide-binding domain protein [Synechococcus sp. PCC 7335]|uniref:cyclic nucleotide-binding domain-containing protein n=1 Tax=Synechococcus sp. (strain ATCC 29403 / PCC 7335) TaxID=91464 RepID=UPI00017EB4B1|nr:cyclic nucleotide-binding domain-containing protein [Synechococcus sp. PCC 7335]EDX84306.1 cyclic nucleotide-binding domain protein [Synechococcus sp. PCC 7335]